VARRRRTRTRRKSKSPLSKPLISCYNSSFNFSCLASLGSLRVGAWLYCDLDILGRVVVLRCWRQRLCTLCGQFKRRKLSSPQGLGCAEAFHSSLTSLLRLCISCEMKPLQTSSVLAAASYKKLADPYRTLFGRFTVEAGPHPPTHSRGATIWF
jgi:hypothetical protein